MKFLKRIFCRHPYFDWVRNIYGDEINLAGGKRSVWECSKCGKREYRDELKPQRFNTI